MRFVGIVFCLGVRLRVFFFFFLRRWEAETETERLKGGYWVLFMREAERLKD